MLWKCVKYPKRKAKLQSSERTLKLFLLFKNPAVTVLYILLWIGSSFRKLILQQFQADTETTFLPILFSNGTWREKKADSKAEEFCIAIPAKEYNFFKCLCWKKIISLPESVSFTELRFSSHGFMDHIALPYLFFLKEQLLFHSQVCQSLISGCFQRKWVFFPRNCILKR